MLHVGSAIFTFILVFGVLAMIGAPPLMAFLLAGWGFVMALNRGPDWKP